MVANRKECVIKPDRQPKGPPDDDNVAVGFLGRENIRAQLGLPTVEEMLAARRARVDAEKIRDRGHASGRGVVGKDKKEKTGKGLRRGANTFAAGIQSAASTRAGVSYATAAAAATDPPKSSPPSKPASSLPPPPPGYDDDDARASSSQAVSAEPQPPAGSLSSVESNGSKPTNTDNQPKTNALAPSVQRLFDLHKAGAGMGAAMLFGGGQQPHPVPSQMPQPTQHYQYGSPYYPPPNSHMGNPMAQYHASQAAAAYGGHHGMPAPAQHQHMYAHNHPQQQAPHDQQQHQELLYNPNSAPHAQPTGYPGYVQPPFGHGPHPAQPAGYQVPMNPAYYQQPVLGQGQEQGQG